MGAEKKRLTILNNILVMVGAASEKSLPVDKKKLIAALCIDYGVRAMKANEYIQTLIDGEKVIIKEDGLWIVKKETI